MTAKKKALEEKVCLDSTSQGDAHDSLNIANIFEESGVEENAEFKHTYDQKRILDAVEKKIQSSEQMLFLDHGAAGAGKSIVMQKVKNVKNASEKEVIVVCPTGITAILIDGGPLLIALSRSKPKMLLQR